MIDYVKQDPIAALEQRRLSTLATARLEQFYRSMFLIRYFEERVLELFSEGQLFGTTHAYIGQEANAVGLLSHLTRDDIVFSNHRCHGHYLAYSDDVDGLLAEIMGRESGICGGKGGSQHICAGNFYTNGVLGGIVPCAAGIALAEKQKHSGAKVIVFIGDGALGEGVIYETFNIAALWSLPMLFVVENNFYAQSTPSRLQLSGEIAARPQAFGIETVQCRPASVEDVHGLAGEAWAYIEHERKPFCLILDTYRFCPHSKSDDHRDSAEIAAWQARDPLRRLAQQLNADRRNTIEQHVRARIAQAVEQARAAAFPAVPAIT
ncbi:MAG TPA: thiamine pyrophosphate-dependent dehydrogenase E1 component subunit alpha [Herpetosiphonaceae bacterium]